MPVDAEDLVWATSASQGTGDVVLVEPVDGKHFMPSAALNGKSVWWVIEHVSLDQVEVIQAVYDHATTTVQRAAAGNEAVTQSTNGGSKVNFGAGGLRVALVPTAKVLMGTEGQGIDAGVFNSGAVDLSGQHDRYYDAVTLAANMTLGLADTPRVGGRVAVVPLIQGAGNSHEVILGAGMEWEDGTTAAQAWPEGQANLVIRWDVAAGVAKVGRAGGKEAAAEPVVWGDVGEKPSGLLIAEDQLEPGDSDWTYQNAYGSFVRVYFEGLTQEHFVTLPAGLGSKGTTVLVRNASAHNITMRVEDPDPEAVEQYRLATLRPGRVAGRIKNQDGTAWWTTFDNATYPWGRPQSIFVRIEDTTGEMSGRIQGEIPDVGVPASADRMLGFQDGGQLGLFEPGGRVPASHAASHGSGGTDEVTVAQGQVTGLSAALAGKAPTSNPTFTGLMSVAGVRVARGTVSGALTAAAHGGGTFITSGNCTLPNEAGFSIILVAGGAHTVNVGSGAGTALAEGDVLTVVIPAVGTVKAVHTPAGDVISMPVS